MEGFNDLLLKLREVHEREVEGWQVKVQELSNKKGCDTKRMEELFTRNQQMKEQQRLLTENIKTLENRLRAGLCDRCTVTQDVAKKRQQEYEASQIQSLQHISLLAGEMNNLKKENKRLRDELRGFRAAHENHRELSSNTSTTAEVKSHSSPDLPPSPVPAALASAAAHSAGGQSAEGNGPVKAESDQRSEETEHRQLRGIGRSHFEPYKRFPTSVLTLPPRKTEHTLTRVVEKRAPSLEGLDQRPLIPPHSLLLKRSPPSGEVNPSRHVLHAPVPCRPQPIKGSPMIPWSLPESCDWANVAAAGAGMALQPSLKSTLPRYPNLVPTSQHANSRRQVYGHSWHKQNVSQLHVKEPTVVVRLENLKEHKESQMTPQEKKEVPPYREKAAAWPKEPCEGPLDLSDRGKPKSAQIPRDASPLSTQDAETGRKSPDKDASALSPRAAPSPPPGAPSLSLPPARQQEEEPTGDHHHKLSKEQEPREEVNGKAEQSAEKKVPVLTITLRPVMLENSTLQKQESVSSNGKSSSPAVEPGSSSDEVECVSGQESSQGCKRKRPAVEAEADRHSDTDNAQHERKIKILTSVRSEEKSPS